ncbi:MAG: malonyl-ACP O-methyltransferase BioC [Gammaproteobacteria bacterium]|nr:malonyl-ACP O-methyltransferase BioC [Gammaproteobacteria bacterium]
MRFSEEVCNAFHRQATVYEAAAQVQREIGEQLFERLSYLKIEPQYVLDLGCGTGLFTKQLKKCYPKAVVVGVDLARGMLTEARAKSRWPQKKMAFVQADMHALPFLNNTFDLVFSNQVLHWSNQWPALMRELNRVMHVGGCLMFSTLGPDTFLELREDKPTTFAHANTFMDMHDIGDILLSERFLDPVVDMDKLAVHYEDWQALLRSLRQQGVRNINAKRNPGLTGKRAWAAFEASVKKYQIETGKYPLTYEVVYGHAWKSEQSVTQSGIETSITISALRNTIR